ncbi:anhydro-N-acetylmuramic acid kinase [Gammaproteobacteria bacterium]|nr:anhydro-N-acetylmuramic acid kinase [Gammaproteobacteria bacterium]
MTILKVLGIMSGSSADGVDFWLARADNVKTPLGQAMITYPKSLKEDLMGTLSGHTSYQDMVLIEHAYTHFLANAIMNWMSIEPDMVVGVHGPTVFHQGGVDSRQLVHGPLLASLLGCPVISEFRIHDILSGGQGAPLAPLYHQERFSEFSCPLAIINIGGICNITLMDEKGIQGFDIGPGNGLMDLICQKYFNCHYDDKGLLAQQGSEIPDLFKAMLSLPFFHQQGPKSIHRDTFNEAWLEYHQVDGYLAMDVLRTALELTVSLIAKEVRGFKHIVVIGGGAHNDFLIWRLQAVTGVQIIRVPDADYIEAQLMAWLTIKRWQGEPLDYQHITGAQSPLLYGIIHDPTP